MRGVVGLFRSVLAGLCLVLWTGSDVGAAEADTAGLVRDVDRLVRLRQEIHREKVEWEAQQQTLGQRVRLLQREKEMLRQRIAETDRVMDEAGEELVELERRRERQERALANAARALDKFDDELATARAAVPNGLDEDLQIDRPASDRVVVRLRNALAWAEGVHRLDQEIHHHRQLMDVPEVGRLQLDLLYLGLSQAYAVSRDDRVAGHGVWNGSQWSWSWDPAWAPVVRAAVQIHEGQQAPRWLHLPIKIVGEEKP